MSRHIGNTEEFGRTFNGGNGAYPVDDLLEEGPIEETEEEFEDYSRELFKREIRRLMHKAVSSERHEALYGLIYAYQAVTETHDDIFD